MEEHAHSQWTEFDIRYVADELSKEYPTVESALISHAIEIAKDEVQPVQGHVKMLAVARTKLVMQQ